MGESATQTLYAVARAPIEKVAVILWPLNLAHPSRDFLLDLSNRKRKGYPLLEQLAAANYA